MSAAGALRPIRPTNVQYPLVLSCFAFVAAFVVVGATTVWLQSTAALITIGCILLSVFCWRRAVLWPLAVGDQGELLWRDQGGAWQRLADTQVCWQSAYLIVLRTNHAELPVLWLTPWQMSSGAYALLVGRLRLVG